ncbi:MAG: ATP-binding protein [Lachnospiraceae bacterium]|nr:ATP-binding protein [Lachnospiraceae bacterium]
MEIKRNSYLQSIIDRQHNGMIKIITGVRRCGKSYLLFTLYYKYLIEHDIDKNHIITIALDDRRNKHLRNPDEILNYIDDKIIDDKMYYIFLDEVQFLDEFEDVLNSLLHIKNADVYVTGSNSKFLSTDIITEFRGRGDEIRIYPLSFKEFFSVYNGSFDEAWDEYFTYGGLPQIVSMNTVKQKTDYLSNLFSKVYITDVIERNRIQNKDELNDLLNILASSIGSLTNPTKIANTFKSVKQVNCSNKTISSYIEYLVDSFLISKVSRYDIKGRKYINANLKYYFVDVGLRNARLNFRQQEENHIMENIIYNELLTRGYNVDVGIVEMNSKDTTGKSIRRQLEVDFVANQGSKRYYIQSAFEMHSHEKTEQEKKSLSHIGDSFKKIIIIRDNIKARHDENGFVTIGLKEFLLNENSLEF